MGMRRASGWCVWCIGRIADAIEAVPGQGGGPLNDDVFELVRLIGKRLFGGGHVRKQFFFCSFYFEFENSYFRIFEFLLSL